MSLGSEHEICGVCDWQHDPVQLGFPGIWGANNIGLPEAQIAYATLSQGWVLTNCAKDPLWRPHNENDSSWHEVEDSGFTYFEAIGMDEDALPYWLQTASSVGERPSAT